MDDPLPGWGPRVQQYWATVGPRNTASVDLLERIGFTPTALPDFGLESFDEDDLVFVLHHVSGT